MSEIQQQQQNVIEGGIVEQQQVQIDGGAKRKPRSKNAWVKFLMSYKRKNKNLSLKEAMKKASKLYKRSKSPKRKSKSTKKSKSRSRSRK